jgi:RNA polymerase sigma-70 factor (family 1)
VDNQELNKLLEKISKDNCKKSFDLIFGYYYPKLVDFADLYLESRSSAEEIASDALLKLFIKRHTWLMIEKPEAYLYKTVKNMSISHLRKNKKSHHNLAISSEKFEQFNLIEREASPEKKLIDEEFTVVVMKMIEEMPPRRKMIFKLIKQEEKSYKEVATLLNISVKTVEVHMGLAIAHIRTSMEKYEKQENLNFLKLVQSFVPFLITLYPLFVKTTV